MSKTLKELQKEHQLLVLETLNDLINLAAENNDERRPVSIGAVLVFSDGSSQSNISGRLDRPQMTGLLVDLSNQVFFECKQREMQDAAEDAMRQVYLASAPTGDKPN